MVLFSNPKELFQKSSHPIYTPIIFFYHSCLKRTLFAETIRVSKKVCQLGTFLTALRNDLHISFQTYSSKIEKYHNISQFFKHFYLNIIKFPNFSLLAVVVAFFICWAPFHVQRLYTIYTTFPKPDEKTHALYLKIYSLVTYVSGILYYISATTNPILYSIMSVKFREAFKETFIKCCGLRIQRGKPPKQYSILSRSNIRNGPESTDSAKDDTFQTNTSLIYKNSTDSFPGSNRFKFSLRRLGKYNDPKNASPNSFTTYASLPVLNHSRTGSKLNKLSQYFECLKKNSSNGNDNSIYDKKQIHFSMEFHRDVGKGDGKCCDSCDISNSSLKDIEHGAIEDELGAYISELKNGEI
ncbi:hypothetical protein ABEB36_006104 [Hypothenemus hampei]|uniref:G-protein coupled receptors family 1 profile domain-containing protein n=1 Tax=Hypothenemus hampei TaxID=57062 RepID=A0ABD1F3M3_HYPHA